MPNIKHAYAQHREAVKKSREEPPPIKALLGAFISGAFVILNTLDPSTVWVRLQSDGSPTIARHKGKVNWDTDDQAIPIELTYDANGVLCFYDYDTSQAGPLYQESGGNLDVPPHTQDASTILYTPADPDAWPTVPATAQEALDALASEDGLTVRLVELLDDGAQMTRLSPLGIVGNHWANDVAIRLLRRPYTS